MSARARDKRVREVARADETQRPRVLRCAALNWLMRPRPARPLAPRGIPAGRGSLDSLVGADARAEYAAEGLDPSLGFALKLARALLANALGAHRVEEALARLAVVLGFDIDVLCTPTSMMATMRDGNQIRTVVVRVEPAGVDLERLCALHSLVGRVERRELSPGDAADRVDAILARPSRFPALALVGAHAITAAASAVLLGGSGLDVPVAGLFGLGVGLLDRLAGRFTGIARLLPAAAAFGVTAGGAAVAAHGWGVRPAILLLAPLVVLLPGLTLTTAMIELATANLVAGTARFLGGAATFLQMAFGVALGRKLAESFPHGPVTAPTSVAPAWGAIAATAIVAFGVAVLLRVRPRDWPWAWLATGAALLGARVGGAWLGAELGAFVGAALVGVVANTGARWLDRPSTLMLVPGVLLLVPGSLGFLSVRSLLENDVAGAVATAFRMLLVAMALAAGILVAATAVPPRRSL